MKTFTAKPETVKRDWYVVDATGKTLGLILGKNGIEKIVELELTAEEKELFAKSAAAVHKTNEALKEVGAL